MKKYLAILALAMPLLTSAAEPEATRFDISRMTCNACVKAVKAQVCKLEGIDTCQVSIGKVLITAKPGFVIDPKKVGEAVHNAGDYEVTGTSKQN